MGAQAAAGLIRRTGPRCRWQTTFSATLASICNVQSCMRSHPCHKIHVSAPVLATLAAGLTRVHKGGIDPPKRCDVAVVLAVGRAPVGTGAGGVLRPAPGDACRYRAAGCRPILQALLARRCEQLRRLELQHHRGAGQSSACQQIRSCRVDCCSCHKSHDAVRLCSACSAAT